MNLWWEMYEKHEKELDDLSPEEDDDYEDDDSEESEDKENAEPRRKRPKKKPKKVGKSHAIVRLTHWCCREKSKIKQVRSNSRTRERRALREVGSIHSLGGETTLMYSLTVVF